MGKIRTIQDNDKHMAKKARYSANEQQRVR